MIPIKKLKEVFGNYYDIASGLVDKYGWIKIEKYYTYFPQNVETKKEGFNTFKRPKLLSSFIEPHFISKTCIGEICKVCKKNATNKLGEEIPFDDPNKMRHNLTAYVCREHFEMIVGGCH